MSDDISDESFNMTAVEVTTHEGAGIRNQGMVPHRGQSCNTTSAQSTLTDEVRPWDTSSSCFGIELRQVVVGDVEFDFGHARRLGPKGPVLRLLRPVTPTVTPEIAHQERVLSLLLRCYTSF